MKNNTVEGGVVKQGYSPKPLQAQPRLEDPSPSNSESRSPGGTGGSKLKIARTPSRGANPARIDDGVVSFDK